MADQSVVMLGVQLCLRGSPLTVYMKMTAESLEMFESQYPLASAYLS